jgi:hypothetical protein
LHILRESSVEQALSRYQNPEEIPEANIKKLKTIGVAEFERVFYPDDLQK